FPQEFGAEATHSLTPSKEDSRENIFVGHFGETVRLADFWSVDARMQGPMEVVNFHLATMDPMKVVSPPFNTTPKDFATENFKRLRLMQMLVIPKDVPGGFQSLAQLRLAKEKELNATGSGYTLQELGEHSWPPDSFVVTISTPYAIFQLYTQSDKYLFFVTSGASPFDKNPDDPILAKSTRDIANSLSTHLDEFRLKIVAEKGFVYDLRIVAIPWAAVCALAALLAFLPVQRLRLIGRATFGFATGGLLIAGPLLFASWRLGLDRVISEASLLLCVGLLMPWICRSVSVRLGGQRPLRVLVWSAIGNVFWILGGCATVRGFVSGQDTITGSRNFWMLSLTFSAMALTNAVILGLSHDESAAHDSSVSPV
ncbi:MAG: hypothetical protein COV48_10685, partial [Elusimicrobia bacterium CG11_big_fil_rev_8_21_14_0_20_64_6]